MAAGGGGSLGCQSFFARVSSEKQSSVDDVVYTWTLL
jgi:hypothetical protein